MCAKYICIKDFCDKRPLNVFHKELEPQSENSEEAFRNRHILFRKEFWLENSENAIVNITADDYFKLYINGEFVVQGPPSGYPQQGYYYMQTDITRFLRKGRNVIAVHTYYQGLVNRVWVSADMREMFWCEVWLGENLFLCSDETWRVQEHSGYKAYRTIGYDTQFTEIYDSRAKEVGFERIDFDDSKWERAAEYKNADYHLLKSTIKPLEIYCKEPERIEYRAQRSVFIDFGQEAVGYLSALAQGRSGDCIIIRYGEELNEDGSVRYDMRCNCIYEDKWILSGGADTFQPFDYKAFRYVELLLPEGCSLREVKRRIRHYPFVCKNAPSLENENLKRIWTLCENTIRYGTQEAFLDCPTREKGQYLGDLAVSGRAQCVLTGDTALLKKSLTNFCHSTFICKGMMAVSCSALNQEIADYSLLFAALCVWVYDFDKDKEFLSRVEPYATGIYEYFKAYENDEGLIDGVREKWNLVDWPANLRDDYDFPLTKPIGKGAHNALNAFYIGMLSALEEMYSVLGKRADLGIGKRKAAFKRCFYDEERGLFCDSPKKTHAAVHSNVLPLLFDIGIENAEVKSRLVAFIRQKGITSMGTYMSYFALAALARSGNKALAIEALSDEGAWLNMLKEGATTTFEAWGKEQKWNTSLFHPWSVAPLLILAAKRIY